MVVRFFDFYREVYLPDHSAPLNRWVHFLSNVSALTCCLAGLLLPNLALFLLGVWFQLGPPYLGHLLFEKTHRSIDQSPVFAALGSWWTTLQIVLGHQSVTWGPPAPATPDPQLLLALLRQHGRNLHSFMVLEPGLSVWSTPARDAAVAYTARGGHWIAAGGPLCAPERTEEVARDFAAAARAHGRTAAFFGVSQPFVDRLAGSGEFDALSVGQAPTWQPARWDESLRKADKLRNRLKRAVRAGVRVRRAEADEVAEGAPLRRAMTEIVQHWAEAHALPPMGFMVTLELFQHAALRRYFVAEHEGRVCGFAVCVPIYGRGGWLVEDMMMAAGAPGGTSEALVDTAMRQLAAEGAQVVSLGMVALAGLQQLQGRCEHPVLLALLRTSARATGWLYNFEGLYRFRDKMRPTAWEPVYLVSSGRVSAWTIRAVLMAFAEGWLPRFGWRALRRRVRQTLAQRLHAQMGCCTPHGEVT
jgi:phosphatidylglycerol lysyltransferase